MNPEEIKNIKTSINDLRSYMENIEKMISGIKIDKQMLLKSNNPIPPGIGTRITFDSNGLILKGEDLRPEDIPKLPMDKIIDLNKTIRSSIEQIELMNINTVDIDDYNIQAGSGTKINYDNHGRIISSSDLLEDDIPNLSISKINGLTDKLSFIDSQINSNKNNDEVEDLNITPGTFSKITFDPKGRVLSGSKLTIDDIPIDIINRISIVESRIPLLASQQTVDALTKDMKRKINSTSKVTPGIYSKVEVDSQGIVISATNLSISDLPNINIKDVIKLETELRKKANYSDFIELSNAVSSIISNDKLNKINKLENQLSTKADNKDLLDISNKVNSIQSLIDNIIEKFPSEYIVDQLNKIEDTLNNLNSRIVSLEQRMKIDNEFDKS